MTLKPYIIRMRDDHYDVIGPFNSSEDAADYGAEDQRLNEDDPRWQTIELADPHAVSVIAPERPIVAGTYGRAWAPTP